MKSTCKGCSADVKVSEEQIDRMVAKLPIQGFDCVPDDVYRDRLAACRDCPSLQYGTTCSHCGCFVRVRARLADKVCPKPGVPSWQAHIRRGSLVANLT